MSHLNKQLTVINLFGAPGTGKSTLAALVFARMKQQGMLVELVTEYAKDLVWSERHTMFAKQDYIFAKQHDRVARLVGKAKIAVTDSPLLTGLFYVEPEYPKTFAPFCFDVFNSFNNINIFLHRVKPYVKVGRYQEESESDALAVKIREMLHSWPIGQVTEMDADEKAVDKILTIYNIERLRNGVWDT